MIIQFWQKPGLSVPYGALKELCTDAGIIAYEWDVPDAQAAEAQAWIKKIALTSPEPEPQPPTKTATIPATPTPLPAVTTTIEPWDTVANVQSRWDSLGDVSSAIVAPQTIELQAQSGALLTKAQWDQHYDLTVEGVLWAQDAPGSSNTNYFGGLAINASLSGDNDYAEIAVQRNVQVRDAICRTITLTQQGANINTRPQGSDAAPFVPHLARMKWVAAQQRVYYYIDEATCGFVAHTFGGPLRVEALCVSVPAGAPNDGSKAMARFGPITTTGVRI